MADQTMDDQSFMKSMFHGVIAEELVFPYPRLASEERDTVLLILESLRRFLQERVDPARIDRAETVPRDVLDEAARLGLYGLEVPAEYGGAGLSASAAARVIQEVATHDASIALLLSAHGSLAARSIAAFGSREQQRRWLPELASGKIRGAFALTELEAGADASAIQTRADLDAESGCYIVTGKKLWVTGGDRADLFVVFARTAPLGDSPRPRMSALLVERSAAVVHGADAPKLGMRGASAVPVTFDGVRVDASRLLGEPGRGFQIAQNVLSAARLSLAASCLGGCRALTRMSVEHARERKTFGRPLAEFGAIKNKIARMLAQTYALESAIYLAGGLVDARTPDTAIEVAICKVLASETLWSVAHEALQVAGAMGYMAAQPYERMLRDARAYALLWGPNEVLRCFIALAGMASPGERVAEVSRAMREPIKGIGLLRDFALRKARSMIVPERMSRAHPLLGREAVLLEESTAKLARQVETALRRHGERIADMQLVQHRVADVAIVLYALSACLARTSELLEQQGEEGARRATDFSRIYGAIGREQLHRCFDRFEINDDELRKDCAARAYDDRGYPLDVL